MDYIFRHAGGNSNRITANQTLLELPGSLFMATSSVGKFWRLNSLTCLERKKACSILHTRCRFLRLTGNKDKLFTNQCIFIAFLQIQEMTTTIKKTFRDETSRYEWIDDQTRQKINEKV